MVTREISLSDGSKMVVEGGEELLTDLDTHTNMRVLGTYLLVISPTGRYTEVWHFILVLYLSKMPIVDGSISYDFP